MQPSYSIYAAKAKLSEIIRLVKQKKQVTITERGVPVARVVPFQQIGSLSDRFVQLRAAGLLTEPKTKPSRLRPIQKRPGALKRFLDNRE